MHQSKVRVDMIYFGKTVHLSHDLSDMRDEIKVFQQHCGGENLCVFRGRLSEGGQCEDSVCDVCVGREEKVLLCTIAFEQTKRLYQGVPELTQEVV